ncbi:hypothetical protein KC345_g11539 [Hortaea werneckii]|nr:hypothetical protein KC345_g11539 [Hortaea werneckii]
MTASCFRLSVHRQLHKDSPTAYNWMAEHTVAAELIGVIAAQSAGYHFAPTFPLYQQQAIRDIRKCLDQGTGALVWKDQFIVITGYDDHKQVFYYSESPSATAEQELPYSGLGRNKSPYWYYQIYERQFATEIPQMIRESFIQAVYKAEVHDPMLPESQYACGLLAYDAIEEAFSGGLYDAAGAYETFMYYAICKKDAASYTREACRNWPELEATARHYERLSAIYEEITAELSLNQDAASSLRHTTLRDLVRAAKVAEAAAIQSIRLLLREPIENRLHDVGLR